jgi:hypothetical protein
VLRIGPYRFFFYSGDNWEPPHVHVESRGKVAKVWINPVRLQHSGGFNRREIVELVRLVDENRELLRSCWDEYFND